MKTMIRSFASALVAVMTLGLVQTAQAEPCSIEQLVEPEGACTITQDKTQAEGGEEVKFTLSNIKEGYQVEDVKVFLYGEGGEIYPEYNYEEDYYSFNMPEENVCIYVLCEKPTTEYSITIPAFKGGSVTSDVSSAQEGAPVTLTVKPDKGYELASIVVVGDGVTIEPEGEGSTYTFTMPPSAVEVQATFKEKLYNINIPEFKGGTVTSNVASTNEGATVTLTVTPDKGYELASIKVDGIDPEKGEGSTYTFEMPASDVEVQATFKEAATKYSITTVADPENTCEFEVYPVEMEAPEGDWVNFRFNLADGANFVSLDVYNTDDPSQSVGYEEFWWNGQQWYRFEMPDYDVTIKVKTESGEAPATAYTITTVADPEGTCLFTVSPESLMAAEGAPVDFHFDLADGANFVSLTVYNTADPTQTICEEDIGTYEDENGVTWYYFTMPDYDVTIKVKTESGGTPFAQAHDISTVADPEGTCLFTLSKTWAWPNDTIDFRFDLADGANFVSLTVYNTDDPSKTIGEEYIGTYEDENGVTWYYFTMPDYNVTIKVTTQGGEAPASGHKISTSVTPSEACAVHAQDSAQSGEEVYFEVGNFAAGATLGSLTVWNMSAGEQVKVEPYEKGYIFMMPDGDVLIEVVCSDPAPTTKYSIYTEVDPANACVITPSKTEAEGADIVTFTLSEFMSGQEIDYVVVRSLDGSAEFQPKYNEEMNEYWFNMPYYDVVIFVHCTSFAPDPGSGHKISTDVTPFGACEVHAQDSAQSGAEVYFEVGNFAAGATLGSLTVWNMSAGEQVKVEPYEKGYIFMMPDGDVLIEVVCSDPAPTTTVAVIPYAADNTSVGGVYTNGIAIASTAEGTYIVDLNATVDVVFDADAGYFFKKDGAYTPVVTNTTTAAADPTEVFGPGPNQGTQVGDSAYAFVDGGTCTIVGSGTADTRLSTVVKPSTITNAVIQSGITEIGTRFFKDFKWLNAVTGGQDLKTVGENAFYKCLSLETIDLDCTAIPTGLDGAVVYQNALKPDGTIYQIPNIKVKNYVATLYGKENANDAEWTYLGPAEDANIYKQGIYHFFQTRLEPEK